MNHQHGARGRIEPRAMALTLLLVLAASLALAPTAHAQTDDKNTFEACEAEYGTGTPAEEGLCKAAALIHARGLDEPLSFIVALAYWGGVALALVAWVFVLLWRTLPKRTLSLTSEAAIAEIPSGESASYQLKLANKRARRPIDVELSIAKPPSGWTASLSVEKELPSGFRELVGEHDTLRVALSARKAGAHTADIAVHIQSPKEAHPEEWSELDVVAMPFYKDEPRPRKSRDLRVITLIKEPETRLVIRNVVHEPRPFRPGDTVTSVVTVANEGTAEAVDVPVTLHVNEELDETHNVHLEPGAEADLTFSWMAPEEHARVRVSIG